MKRFLGYLFLLSFGYVLGILTAPLWGDRQASIKNESSLKTNTLAEKSESGAATSESVTTKINSPVNNRDDSSQGNSEATNDKEVSNNFFDFSQVVSDFLIPREKKITVLTNLTAFTEEDLAKISNIDEFANNLWSLAARDTQARELAENPDTYGKLIFSTGLNDHNAGGRTIFSPQDYKIFTVYTLNSVNDNRVLVKWMNQSTGELKLFKQISINPQLEQNYLWVNELRGWKPGTYIVEFYTMDENLELLAGSRYYVQ